MQLFTLSATYYPEKVVENYESLIWTERFRAAGDFELRTAYVKETMVLLPIGSCVCILESNEVMFVEQHEITIDAEKGETKLIVTGRSFETFFENRITLITPAPIKDLAGDVDAVTMLNKTSANAAKQLLLNASGSALDVNEVIPNITISTDTLLPVLPLYNLHIARGSVYPELLRLLEINKLGIASRRALPGVPKLNINIFIGRNLTKSVVFNIDAGHFSGSLRLLMSNKDYKTAVHVASTAYYRKVYTSLGAKTGLLHRVDLLDQSDVTKVGTTIPPMLDGRGRSYLAIHPLTTIFEGSVSFSIPYVYGTHYRLGDLILVKITELNFTDEMYITEYIRVENEDGENGYPTLSETN